MLGNMDQQQMMQLLSGGGLGGLSKSLGRGLRCGVHVDCHQYSLKGSFNNIKSEMHGPTC